MAEWCPEQADGQVGCLLPDEPVVGAEHTCPRCGRRLQLGDVRDGRRANWSRETGGWSGARREFFWRYLDV